MLGDTAGEALAFRGADAGATALGWGGNAAPPHALAGDGSGDGGKEGDKEPPCLRGERPPSQSPIVRRISDYAGLWCPREGEAELSSGSRVFAYLGRGECGRGTQAWEGARRPFPRVSFKESPALPFPPSPSPQPYLHFKSAL